MLTYSIRRVLEAIPTLLILLTLTFFLLRFAPGGPFDTDRALPPEVMANIEARYGLDQPLWVQYKDWVADAVQGDFRESFQYYGRPVSEIIGSSLPISVQLGLMSLVLCLAMGIPLGCVAAWKKNSIWDASSMFLAIAGVSLPSYLVASILILVFSLGLGWLPPALLDEPLSWVLPVVTLGLRPVAIVARMVRASMLEALASDYVRTALSKGASEIRVVFLHALRNSLIPVITVMGPIAANLVTGSFLVEMVFQIPGLGKHFVTAVINRDYPLVMGVTFCYGIVLIAGNILVDLTYAWADPRIRMEEST